MTDSSWVVNRRALVHPDLDSKSADMLHDKAKYLLRPIPVLPADRLQRAFAEAETQRRNVNVALAMCRNENLYLTTALEIKDCEVTALHGERVELRAAVRHEQQLRQQHDASAIAGAFV